MTSQVEDIIEAPLDIKDPIGHPPSNLRLDVLTVLVAGVGHDVVTLHTLYIPIEYKHTVVGCIGGGIAFQRYLPKNFWHKFQHADLKNKATVN